MADVRAVAQTVIEAPVTSQTGGVRTGVYKDSTVRRVSIPVQTTVYMTSVALTRGFVILGVHMVSMATCVT